MSAAENILIIKLGALGDFIQALGPMAAIRRHHPAAQITLLTTAPFVTMARESGAVDRVLLDRRPKWHQPGRWLALRKALNDGRFARVYDLQNNDRTRLYFRLFSPKPEWVGTAKGASHYFDPPERTAGHAFDGHVMTLRHAGIADVTIDDLGWVTGDAARFALPEPFVLLVPGCAPSRPQKRWPPAHYGVLARHLYSWGYTPVILGTAAERDEAQTITAACPQTVDLTGRTDLFDIIRLGRAAAAVIGNDTGPMHLIAPTGCPSWVLFSRYSDPVRHRPRGPHVQTIQNNELAELAPETVIGNLDARAFRQPPRTG